MLTLFILNHEIAGATHSKLPAVISVRDSADVSFLHRTAQSEQSLNAVHQKEEGAGQEGRENATGGMQSHYLGPGIEMLYLHEIQYSLVVNHNDYIITLPKYEP